MVGTSRLLILMFCEGVLMFVRCFFFLVITFSFILSGQDMDAQVPENQKAAAPTQEKKETNAQPPDKKQPATQAPEK